MFLHPTPRHLHALSKENMPKRRRYQEEYQHTYSEQHTPPRIPQAALAKNIKKTTQFITLQNTLQI